MNGPHDVGGRHGFGPVPIEADEPIFHAPWERRVFGMARAQTPAPGWNLDFGRHSRERMPHWLYYASSYYQRWLFGREAALIAAGYVSVEELRDGHAHETIVATRAPVGPDKVVATLATGYNAEREIEAAPRFAAGDRVRTRNLQPGGHTRLPGYARNRTGTVEAHRGAFVLPDTNAHGRGEQPGHLYTVIFTAEELWGRPSPAGDTVALDLWESYLDAV